MPDLSRVHLNYPTPVFSRLWAEYVAGNLPTQALPTVAPRAPEAASDRPAGYVARHRPRRATVEQVVTFVFLLAALVAFNVGAVLAVK